MAAKLAVISRRDAELLAALKANPAVAAGLAKAQASGTTPTPAQLAAVRKAIGPTAFAQLLRPTTPADLKFVTQTAPKVLGPANFAALAAPTPALKVALATLAGAGPEVKQAAADSPQQWRTYFFIAVGGEIVFIPLIFLMAGFWSPRRAKRAEEEHEAFVAAEMEKLRDDSRAPVPVPA